MKREERGESERKGSRSKRKRKQPLDKSADAHPRFMLAQGPSQAIVSLEWDTIWAMNKKVSDEVQ